MATTYLTLDELADLSAASRAAARTLSFKTASPNTLGNDFEAAFAANDAASARNAIFRLEAIAGARYFFQSISFIDPDRLKLYDADGKAIVANDEGDDPAQSIVNNLVINQDVIDGWQAPYSGSFYIDASWFTFPGLYDQTGLVVFEDRDPPKTTNRAPVLAAPLADASWSEGSSQTWTLPYTTFTDPDAGPLAWSVRLADGSPLPTWLKFDAQTRKLSGTAPLDSPDLNLRVTATDTGRLAVSDDVRLSTTEPTTGLTLSGTAGDDVIRGTRFNDTISTAAGQDRITGGGGDDTLRGGAGIDTAVYAGPRANFKITVASSGVTVADSTAAEGRDTLTEIERLQFADKGVALDLSGNAGVVVKLLGVVFGPASVSSASLVGIGLRYADQGMGYGDLAALAVAATGRTAARDVVDLLWTNVFGTPPTADQALPFVNMLGSGTSIGQLAQMAAETSYNAAGINLVGLISNGVDFTPG